MLDKTLYGVAIFAGLCMILASLLVCFIMIFGIIDTVFETGLVLLIMTPVLKILIAMCLFWGFILFTIFICILIYLAHMLIKECF